MDSLESLFRKMRGQELQENRAAPRSAARSRAPARDRGGDRLKAFMAKYRNLAETIDGLGAVDLAFYFREKAHEAGIVSFTYKGGKYVSDAMTDGKKPRPRYAILYDDGEYGVGSYQAGGYDYAPFSHDTLARTEAEAAAKFDALLARAAQGRKLK
jgi:hypothetical protein